MRIRVLLPLIIVVLAVSCQSTPTTEEAGVAPAAGLPAAGPDAEALEALVAELRQQNRELTGRAEASGEALQELEASLGTAVAPEEANLSQQELLGRARALRQENQ